MCRSSATTPSLPGEPAGVIVIGETIALSAATTRMMTELVAVAGGCGGIAGGG